MTVYPYILSLLDEFVQHFTTPGFAHFTCFMLAHMTLLGLPHCVTETMRLTGWHKLVHWTAPYAFLKRGCFSCQKLSRTLLALLLARLLPAEAPLILALDDTLIKKWGRKFFGLGRYPDPTDKNPGAGKRQGLGPLLGGGSPAFGDRPRPVVLFPPGAPCCFVPQLGLQEAGWPFATKIALARLLLRRLGLAGRPDYAGGGQPVCQGRADLDRGRHDGQPPQDPMPRSTTRPRRARRASAGARASGARKSRPVSFGRGAKASGACSRCRSMASWCGSRPLWMCWSPVPPWAAVQAAAGDLPPALGRQDERLFLDRP